jgi:CubicO group peptidase (beta-lactamase class C family)
VWGGQLTAWIAEEDGHRVTGANSDAVEAVQVCFANHEVQNWALTYLREVALQDFSSNYNDGAQWLAARRDRAFLAQCPRGGPAGMILRGGRIVAEWGDTNHVDPTYSSAKSFLSTLCGLAVDRGMIKSVNDPMKQYATDDGYDSPHNAKITWKNHLQQTSEWEGAMWGKNSNFLGAEEFGRGQRRPRTIQDPGTFWEYNDVRINRMSLTLLEIWKKPLPRVLKDEIMDRIGASNSWQYHGYFNSTVLINGKQMESVSGGTRWGGGLWISARDEARFGYLFLRRGKWKNKQIVSENWIKMATTPTTIGQDYGYLWWLNTQRKLYPSAPATSFAARGAGSNTIWIDPEHDLVVVWCWHQDRSADELFKRILAAVKTE